MIINVLSSINEIIVIRNVGDNLNNLEIIDLGLIDNQEFEKLIFSQKYEMNLYDICRLSLQKYYHDKLKNTYLDYIYFLVVKELLLDKKKDAISLTNLINQSYPKDKSAKDKWGLSKAKKDDEYIINIDTYRRKITQIIRYMFPDELYSLSNFYKSSSRGNINKKSKISNWFKNEIDLYLTLYKNETFIAYREHRFSDITFEQFSDLIVKIRNEILALNDGFTSLRLLNSEIISNFFTIMLICKKLNIEVDKKFKYKDEEPTPDEIAKISNFKVNTINELIYFFKIPIPALRYLCIEKYNLIGFKKTLENLNSENIDYLTMSLNSAAQYAIYLIKSIFKESEIYNMIKDEKSFIEKIFNNMLTKTFLGYNYDLESSSNIADEGDFKIVMNLLLESNIIQKYDVFYINKYIKIAKDYTNNKSMNLLSKEYNYSKCDIERIIGIYDQWLDTVDVNDIIKKIKFAYAKLLKATTKENEIAYKIATDINKYADSNKDIVIHKLAKKYQINGKVMKIISDVFKRKKAIDPNIIIKIILEEFKLSITPTFRKIKIGKEVKKALSCGLSKKDINEYLNQRYKMIEEKNIFNYINNDLRSFIIFDFSEGMSKSEIIDKYEINLKTLSEFLTPKDISIILKNELRKNPKINMSKLGIYYHMDRRTVQKYIEFNNPLKREISSKLDNYKNKVDELYIEGYSSYKIYSEIVKIGYMGKVGIIKRYLNLKRLYET